MKKLILLLGIVILGCNPNAEKADDSAANQAKFEQGVATWKIFPEGIAERDLDKVMSIFWAIHLHIVSFAVLKLPIFKFSIIQFIICGFLLFIYGSIFDSQNFLNFTNVSSSGIFYLFYCSLGSVCIGFTLQMFGQRLVEPTPAALIMSTEAIFAAIFAWIILSEVLNFNGLVGASLIFLGVIFVQLAPKVKI